MFYQQNKKDLSSNDIAMGLQSGRLAPQKTSEDYSDSKNVQLEWFWMRTQGQTLLNFLINLVGFPFMTKLK